MEMGRSYSKNEGQQVDQTLHRVATKEREEIKRTTKQKMARRHNRGGGNHLDQESNRQTTMEDIDRGLHPAVAGQSLDETRRNTQITDKHGFPHEQECGWEKSAGSYVMPLKLDNVPHLERWL